MNLFSCLDALNDGTKKDVNMVILTISFFLVFGSFLTMGNIQVWNETDITKEKIALTCHDTSDCPAGERQGP